MKIIDTIDTSYHISKMINDAQIFLLIVSPFLKITSSIRIDLEECFKRCQWNMIVYRENQLNKDEFEWLSKQKNLQLVNIENLHAKCYLNEDYAMLSSMNLYEYSQINNHELSVLFSKTKDRDGYYDLSMKIIKILRSKEAVIDMAFLSQLGRYRMSDLYIELKRKYNFTKRSNVMDSEYHFICDVAKRIMNFSKDELYKDGSAVLRNTFLGKEKFDILYKELSRLGKPITRAKSY